MSQRQIPPFDDIIRKQGFYFPSYLFRTRVQLAIEEDAAIQILLGAIAKFLVLPHDVLEEVANVGKLVVGCVFVPVDLVLHGRLGRRDGHAALDEEEIRRPGGRGVGIEVGADVSQAGHVGLVGCVVLDVAACGFDPVLVEICYCRESWVAGRAMVTLQTAWLDEWFLDAGLMARNWQGKCAIASNADMTRASYLVVVIRQCLPVVVSNHFPLMIKLVLVRVEPLQTRLLVDSLEIIIPLNLRLGARIHVHPHEAPLVDVDVDAEQSILLLVE